MGARDYHMTLFDMHNPGGVGQDHAWDINAESANILP